MLRTGVFAHTRMRIFKLDYLAGGRKILIFPTEKSRVLPNL